MFWKFIFAFAICVFASNLTLAQISGGTSDTNEVAEQQNSPAPDQAETGSTDKTHAEKAGEQSDKVKSAKNDGGNSAPASNNEIYLLFITEIIYILLVLVGGPIYSCRIAKNKPDKAAELKGLNLPEGSVRSILALITVGSFIIFLVLGSNMPNFDNVVSAFGTLTGAVIGFYFAHRGAKQPT